MRHPPRTRWLLGLSVVSLVSSCTAEGPAAPPPSGGCSFAPVSPPAGDGPFTWSTPVERCTGPITGSVVVDWDLDGRTEFAVAQGRCVLLFQGCTRTQTLCPDGASPSDEAAPATAKADVDHDGRPDLVLARDGAMQPVTVTVILNRGARVEVIEGSFAARGASGYATEVSVLPRRDGTSLLVVGRHTSGGDGTILEPTAWPDDLCMDASGATLTDVRILERVELPPLLGVVLDPRARTLRAADDPGLAAQADSFGSAVTDLDGDGRYELFVTDEHGASDLLVDGPQGLEDRTRALLGEFWLDGMGAFVTADNVVGVSGFGSVNPFRWNGQRFTYGAHPFNPTIRVGERWDCHWLDLDASGRPDVLCGGSTRGTGIKPEFVAMLLPQVSPSVRAVLQALVPSMAATPFQELLLLDNGAGAYRDLRRTLASEREDTYRLGVLDAGRGRLRIARYLTPRGSEYDGCAQCELLTSDVEVPGHALGHGLVVHLDRFPEPGTEVRLTCNGATQTWRWWAAGRRGSYADFAHFGCGAATTYERLEIVRGGGTVRLPGGALDRSLRCGDTACTVVDG